MKTKPRSNKRLANERMYLIGFLGKGQEALYSKNAWAFPTQEGGVTKMTLTEARKHLLTLGDGPRGIFKAVPLPTPKKGKKK